MQKSSSSLPKVSFIIPTLNAEKFLTKCLSAIRKQDYPQTKIEVIVVDGGSNDKTVAIAKKFACKIVKNPFVNQEPGKNIGLTKATGKICLFLDADNVLAHKNWTKLMIKPFLENPKVKGFLPQTIPAPDSNSLDRYLGYLATDPFTWFIYGNATNPKDFEKVYSPLKKTSHYTLYKFTTKKHPIFGFAQGAGTVSSFKKTGIALYDDILAGIKLIKEGGIIAYVPQAGVYHYHISGLQNFIQKYRWRIRNNFQQRYKGFGFVNREKFMTTQRKQRRLLFILYAFSLIFPLIDAIKLSIKNNDLVMFWHVPITLILALLILIEFLQYKLQISTNVSSVYGK